MSIPKKVLRLLNRELDTELSLDDRRELSRLKSPELESERRLWRTLSKTIRDDRPSTPIGLTERILNRIASHAPSDRVDDTPGGEDSSGGVRWLMRSAAVAAALLVLNSLFYVAELPKEAQAERPRLKSQWRPEEAFLEGLKEGELPILREARPHLRYLRFFTPVPDGD